LNEAGIRVFEGIDSNEIRVATTIQVIMKMLACCEEVMKLRKNPQPLVLDLQIALLGF
jgi:hypothetical protein